MDDLEIQETVELGERSMRGNLLGIQPWMRQADYASADAFYSRLDGYFQAARQKGWIQDKTVVVLPEYLGTWLVVAGENLPVIQSPTIAAAMRLLISRHLVAFARGLLFAKERSRVEASLFRLKAVDMARIYQSVFSGLAKKYAVTLVAGSILLPEPVVEDGQVKTGKGALFNTSAVFRPDGIAEPRLVKKAFPIASELPFVQAAAVSEIPVYQAPCGSLGVLICADSWFPAAIQRIKDMEAEILVVPSAVLPGSHWNQPWLGYSGYANPPDVDTGDVGQLLETQAWDKYALEGRFANSGARYGMNLFLYGDIWDLSPCGGRWKMVSGQTVMKGSRDGAALINLNL
jgi:predicted amidohydrolase